MLGVSPILTARSRFKKNTCQSFHASFRMLPDKRVRIFFLKRDLPPSVIHTYFGTGFFEMPSAFDLPVNLTKSLGLDTYKIQPGLYVVREDKEHLMIDV
jgi:hypothetical protein